MKLRLPKMKFVNELRRGDMVVATRQVDPPGANVREGTVGIVFEETNYYGDGAGPMVRWLNMGQCNVYDVDVRYLRKDDKS